MFHSARMAQRAADAEPSESCRGINETEGSAASKLDAIRDGLRRGLSSGQIAATGPDIGLSASTIYQWVDADYAGMTNLDLRRKVGHEPHGRSAPRRPTRHSARLLTLLHRPTSFQLAIPVADGTCESVLASLSLVRAALGAAGARHVFRLVVTDNSGELADEDAIEALLSEREDETRLYNCNPSRANQKGGCEKNHVEVRKLLPKGRGVRSGAAGPVGARPDAGLRGEGAGGEG